MNNKVFISCAVTGSGDTAKKHPDLPKTPKQIDEAAIQSKVSEIESAMHGISTKLYEAAASAVSEEQSPADGSSINIEDDVVDADYEVIDDTD